MLEASHQNGETQLGINTVEQLLLPTRSQPETQNSVLPASKGQITDHYFNANIRSLRERLPQRSLSFVGSVYLLCTKLQHYWIVAIKPFVEHESVLEIKLDVSQFTHLKYLRPLWFA